MDNESNPNDEEKLKSLLETLRKNDEKVPKELLRTKYKKPYRELKESIKEVADRMLNGRIREGIVIKTDEAGQVLIKQIQTTLDEKRKRTRQGTLQRIQSGKVPADCGRNQNRNLESVDTLLAGALLLICSTGMLRGKRTATEDLQRFDKRVPCRPGTEHLGEETRVGIRTENDHHSRSVPHSG